jgi:hypothetical protein
MSDTVESLRTELNALRAEFEEFKNYAKPVIDGHQYVAPPMPMLIPSLPLPPTFVPNR